MLKDEAENLTRDLEARNLALEQMEADYKQGLMNLAEVTALKDTDAAQFTTVKQNLEE